MISRRRDKIARLQAEGNTTVLVGDESAPVALIALRDQPRPNTRRPIDSPREAGVQTVIMLTGDNERTARAIGAEIGMDQVVA